MSQTPSHTSISQDTVLETALGLPTSMERACKKLAISQEQSKLLNNLVKLKMGTRGVELLIGKIILDDICTVGEEIAGEVSDIEFYNAIMRQKIKTAESKHRKWKREFQRRRGN